MRAKRVWTIQSFLTCFLWNAVLITVLFLVARRILELLHQWVDPFLQVGDTTLPQDVVSAFDNLNRFLLEVGTYLAPALFGLGAFVTLLMWLFIMLQGRGLAKRLLNETQPGVSPVVEGRGKKKAEAKEPKAAPVQEPQPAPPSPQPAVQMLSILQREGRLIDFLQEDLTAYDDSQIGAAVRSIHQGCKNALDEHVTLEPIYKEEEGIEVTVAPSFDARAVRLTGSVAGDPPFKGILRHRGWKVVRVDLPQLTTEQVKDWVLAPAEVEIGE
jgi:hypothetical protein